MLNSDNIYINNNIRTNHCKEIIDDVEGYLKLSKENEDFELAVINLKQYKDFEIFFNTAIGKHRRSEYRKALKEGYYARELSIEERNDRRDELFAINTSAGERQGKMSEEYLSYPQKVEEYNCSFHFYKIYGVFSSDDTWIGYIYPRFCGEVVRTYRILGHAKYFGKINFIAKLV